MKQGYLFLILSYSSFVYPQTDTSLVLNEIMFYAPSGNNEFIEIYNLSETASFNLHNYKIKVESAGNDLITDAGYGSVLPPQSYAVILEGDYEIASGVYRNIIPANSLILRISDKAFGSGGMSNTSDRIIRLLNSEDETIDSHIYRADNNPSFSEEKIIISGSSSEINWGNSSELFGTPGYINSISIKNFDPELKDIIFNPAAPAVGNNVSISAKVRNSGRLEAAFNLTLSIDINSDSWPETELEQINDLLLEAEDSVIIKFNYVIENIRSKLNLYVAIRSNEDQDTSNNYLSKIIYPGYPFSSLVVNEIMFSPMNGEPEWIEIYNTTGDSINLKEWSVSDIYTVSSASEIKVDAYIPAKSFFVISKDSSIKTFHRTITSEILVMNFPNLNNDADGIILKDERGSTIDSVKYESSWGRSGFSLERISAAAASVLKVNWSPSDDIEMSTPGRVNTASPKLNDLSVSQIFFDPPFPTPGQNVFIKAEIKNNGSRDAHNFIVEFYIISNSEGSAEYDPESLLVPLLSSGDSIIVNSRLPINNLRSRIRGAVHIMFDTDEDTWNNYAEKIIEPGFQKHALLINEVMFDPEVNEPEWIELLNPSGDTINLNNWSVSDLSGVPVKDFISTSDLFINPDELLVIAKDTSFLSAHPETQSKVTFADFGSMSNTNDGVLLHDFRNAVIDSLMYRSSWENMKGYSIERIDPFLPACDSTNWAVSLNAQRSTPGSPNSVLYIPEYERNSAAVNEIMYDPETDNCEFIEIYNKSVNEINIGGWKIEDENGNFSKLSKINLVVPPLSYFTLFPDSAGLKKYNLDSSFFLNVLNTEDLGLSNSGELILLKDLKGKIIDSVWFSEHWHNTNLVQTKNRSLERINPSVDGNNAYNWSSSADLSGATPGRINSIYAENKFAMQSNISISPNPFSPDNDGFEDFTIINCRLTHPASQIRIKVFDSRGRLVRTLVNNLTAGSNTSVVFDGREDDGSSMRMGIYIIFLEAIDKTTGVLETLKTTVVIARKLK